MATETLKRTLFATVCLSGVAATLAGCATGSYSHHGRDNAQGPRQNGEQEVAQSRDPDSEAYVGNVPPRLQTGTAATTSRSYTYGTATSTVVMPASTVVAPTTATIAPTTTTTVLVP